ncbi:heat shock factor protein 5-like [Falco peregrinus]|uniref:heat shock factor protein 5-like n=1 Tax=Falco peregrinus TaxID=8954 RepID=UPI00247A566D|nr:heat shock factor protein 5-like [Falco peregrinus]
MAGSISQAGHVPFGTGQGEAEAARAAVESAAVGATYRHGRVAAARPRHPVTLLGMPLAGQPLLLPSMLSNANGPGLLTGGQFHQLYGQGVFPPYSYTATSCQAPSTSPAQRLDPTPVPSTWIQQGPLGLLPGQGASPAFPDKGAAFPVLQTLPTGATYTLQPVASLPPLQQGTQSVAASIANCSSSASSVPYSQACYPTATPQSCSAAAHTDPLAGCAGPTASACTHDSFVQNPPMQSSYEAELMPSDWLCNTSEENKKAEVSLEAMFQVAAEVHSSCKAEKVGVAPVESQNSILELNGNQALPVNSYTPSSTEESQLECLAPVTSDTSFLVAADRTLNLSPLQPSDILCAADTTLSIETAAAAKILQELLTTQEADEERSKEPHHRAAEFSLMIFQEELFSPEQLDAFTEVSRSEIISWCKPPIVAFSQRYKD